MHFGTKREARCRCCKSIASPSAVLKCQGRVLLSWAEGGLGHLAGWFLVETATDSLEIQGIECFEGIRSKLDFKPSCDAFSGPVLNRCDFKGKEATCACVCVSLVVLSSSLLPAPTPNCSCSVCKTRIMLCCVFFHVRCMRVGIVKTADVCLKIN